MNKSWTIFGGIVGLLIGGAYVLAKEKSIREFASKIKGSQDPSHTVKDAEKTKNYINVKDKCINSAYAQNILQRFPKRGNIILSDINAIIQKNINVPHMMHLINMLINLGLTTDIIELDYLKLEREILNNQHAV